MSAAPSSAPRPGSQRAVGMAMMGSAIALATVAGLAYGGVLPFDPGVRVWVAAGVGIAAILDALIGLFFLRSSSQS